MNGCCFFITLPAIEYLDGWFGRWRKRGWWHSAFCIRIESMSIRNDDLNTFCLNNLISRPQTNKVRLWISWKFHIFAIFIFCKLIPFRKVLWRICDCTSNKMLLSITFFTSFLVDCLRLMVCEKLLNHTKCRSIFVEIKLCHGNDAFYFNNITLNRNRIYKLDLCKLEKAQQYNDSWSCDAEWLLISYGKRWNNNQQ